MTEQEMITEIKKLIDENAKLRTEHVVKRGKKITIRDIPQRSYTTHGKQHERNPLAGHNADIVKGESIRLHGIETNRYGGPALYDVTFRIGDNACYDSYNLYYFGIITSIGEKTVTIRPQHSAGLRRLDISDFSYRNRGDVEKKYDNNRNWMD